MMMNEWKFFVLGRDKTPLPNCPRCANQPRDEHPPDQCECLTCHGFYAGTSDPDRLDRMTVRYPGHPWAVRTGSVSGIVVLDFDVVGLSESLDEWESWMGADWRPPADTLVASTPSGGRHYYYEHPGSTRIRSRNRVLPGLDIKADGGYVVVPYAIGEGRAWLNPRRPVPIPPEMLAWLSTAAGTGGSGASVGHGQGYDFERFKEVGCPEGSREEFFNDLIFRSRKRGLTYDEAAREARAAWEICQQPPTAKWFWAWEHVVYKLRRIYATVDPTVVPEWQREAIAALSQVQTSNEAVRVRRVTLVRRRPE